MVKRPHLALVPAHGLRPRFRAPSRRAAAVVAAALGLAGLAYLAARETSLFALRELEVTGAPPRLSRDVEAVAAERAGESLVALDRGSLRRTLEALPTVRAVELDRAFPHTLRISVAPEQPLAVLKRGKEEWLLSQRGRVMRPVEPGKAARRPRVLLAGEQRIAAGDLVDARDVTAALSVLRRLPADFPARVAEARATGQTVTLFLAAGGELRLGERTNIPLKLEVAARVLRTLAPGELADVAYVAVDLPERPVVALNSQL